MVRMIKDIYEAYKSNPCFWHHDWRIITKPYIPNRPIQRGGVDKYMCIKCFKTKLESWKAF